MDDIAIGYNGIVKLLLSLKTGKAPGPYEIPNYVLRNCADIIAHYLVILFTKSLEDGSIPKDWKLASIFSMHKFAPRNNTQNCRPISLTCQYCKLMEHAIYSNLIKHLNVHNYFISIQHCFRASFSCNTQLLEFYLDIALPYDDHKQVDCILFYFWKAFDVVPHRFILKNYQD